MAEEQDPRVFFAAERTLLAWLRTGLAIVGLGFVVARFGLFVRLVGGRMAEASGAGPSGAIGVTLVALGGLAIFGAAWQHLSFCRHLPKSDIPAGYWPGFALWISLGVATATLILAAYLLTTS